MCMITQKKEIGTFSVLSMQLDKEMPTYLAELNLCTFSVSRPIKF